MRSEVKFADNILKSFQKIIMEIEKGSTNNDVHYIFVKYFVEDVLGHASKNIILG